MRYLWSTEGRYRRRVLHIERHDAVGNGLMLPFCSVRIPFDRTINAPWAFGHSICRVCKRLVDGLTP